MKITRKPSRLPIWVLISFYDQESNKEYKKVIKILNLGNDFLLGSRLQECVQELRFGCWFLFMIKKVTRLQEGDQDLAFGY